MHTVAHRCCAPTPTFSASSNGGPFFNPIHGKLRLTRTEWWEPRRLTGPNCNRTSIYKLANIRISFLHLHFLNMRYNSKSPATFSVPTLAVTDENAILVHAPGYKIVKSMRPSSIPVSVLRRKQEAMPLGGSEMKTLVDRQANRAVLERSTTHAFGASSEECAEPPPRANLDADAMFNSARCMKRVDAITKRRGNAVAKRRREDR
jgi:hypothetical protein